MQSPEPTGPHPTQPKTVWHSPSAPGASFQGFSSPAGNLAQLFNEIWDLQCYGLNKDLRFTLLAVARETVGEASQRGHSICDFAAVSWARWMERLEVSSINTAKARMARLVEMGLVEVLPGEYGPRGGMAPRFRLRWAHGGADFGTPAPVLQDQKPNPGPWERRGANAHPFDARQVDTRQVDARQTDTHQFDPCQIDTRQSDSLCFDQNSSVSTNNSNQSISPSILEVNELIKKMTIELNLINSNQNQSIQSQGTGIAARAGETGRPAFDVSPWLMGGAGEPWPEPLFQGLGAILDPHRLPGLAKRSPWTGEGAWAILQAICANGRNLGNPAGTLWNALLQIEKGAFWLTAAGPILRKEGWRTEPEDGTTMAIGGRAEGGRRLAQRGFSRLPLHGEALARHQSLRAEALRRECQVEIDDDEDLDYGDGPSAKVEEPMAQIPEEKVTRAEELSPEMKAQLRLLIETFREASLAARRSPAINRPGFFDTCSESFQGIGAVLEPILPLQLKLPDEYLPVTIRRRAQIKTNILHPLYLAVS